MIKAQLHTHIKGDPADAIPYTWKDLIDRAKTHNYKVLAITCHRKIIFPAKAISYAKKYGILLIKGIEIEIKKKHIIILNPHKSAEQIQTFEDLRNYRANHPKSFVFAPHPYYPICSLKNSLEKHIDLFDAIEHSVLYTKLTTSANKKAEQLAHKHNKPLIATSDCHLLKYLDESHTLIDLDQKTQLTTKKILDALRNNNLQIQTKPLPVHKATKIAALLIFQKLRKMLSMI
jgi:predicted metal-dependent phosphoesterase TrpH